MSTDFLYFCKYWCTSQVFVSYFFVPNVGGLNLYTGLINNNFYHEFTLNKMVDLYMKSTYTQVFTIYTKQSK